MVTVKNSFQKNLWLNVRHIDSRLLVTQFLLLYRNFQPFTRTADYLHWLIFAERREKNRRTTHYIFGRLLPGIFELNSYLKTSN